jgi:hypothetical protein
VRVFERPGPVNTDEVIKIAEVASSKYKYLVAASITGDSVLRLTERIRNREVICVTCPQGMNWEVEKMGDGPFATIPELQQIRTEWMRQGLTRVPMGITQENKERLAGLKVKIVQGTIPLFGPTFSMRLHLQKTTDLDLMAKTLELISTGTLVCLECVLMSVDAGVVPEGEEVIALAGTERGLDTAWVLRASASHNLFHPSKGTRFIELLAKPGIPIIPDVSIESIVLPFRKIEVGA